ncbi:MAG: hypothetical protein A2172_03460 [Candidatus Woykebacteria bacterium RBG_13_40_15]|uniref:DUF3800 domain-containing protein n=1 Tax=Candidatus Woykebacteria bacterium RBG_13_40_15 TaxID=1802593 RepID=A0A1G1W5Q8_9BACT|nr:MAG: hypothetical protein A2172_03460 [Candidatus Woykebacteria bacterium RBG_13_40_15]
MLVFIDDSGDPGFKIDKGSTKVFVIALVVFDDDLEAEKTSLAIKELRRKLKVSDFYEFKFNKTNKKFKDLFFETVKTYKFRIRAIVAGKQNIRSSHLRNNKENFYNYIIMQVLKHSSGSIKNARLKFDKRGEKELRDQLRTYLSRELDNKSKKIFKDLKFVESRQNTLIQLADMVAGSIFSVFSGKEKRYLNELKSSKKIEDLWEFK